MYLCWKIKNYAKQTKKQKLIINFQVNMKIELLISTKTDQQILLAHKNTKELKVMKVAWKMTRNHIELFETRIQATRRHKPHSRGNVWNMTRHGWCTTKFITRCGSMTEVSVLINTPINNALGNWCAVQ